MIIPGSKTKPGIHSKHNKHSERTHGSIPHGADERNARASRSQSYCWNTVAGFRLQATVRNSSKRAFFNLHSLCVDIHSDPRVVIAGELTCRVATQNDHHTPERGRRRAVCVGAVRACRSVCIVSKGNASGCCVSVSRRCHISA